MSDNYYRECQGINMLKIHPTAIIANPEMIPGSVTVGPYAIIENDVTIGENVWIDSHVSIKSGARIGPNCKFFHGGAIAGPPQDLKYAGEKTELIIGANNIFREFVTLNRGTTASGRTVIGDNCLVMAYVHVAHDCRVGSNVVIANTVEMGGHVEIGDYATIGGGTVIHQFCHIGEHSMIGGGFKVAQDVLPFSLNGGHPLKCVGLNSIGLKRRDFSHQTRAKLKMVFFFLLSSGLKTSEAVKKIEDEIEPIPEVRRIVEFIRTSERGVVK
jgi:UDP-N-acetylglucosamine acyltransferase